jgi:hypothetical protein
MTEGHDMRIPVSDTMHAYEVTSADLSLINLVRNLVGTNLPLDVPWVLPSGKVITAAEMRRWLQSGLTQ